MSDAKFVLYIRKFMKNPLLGRKQCVSTSSRECPLSSACSFPCYTFLTRFLAHWGNSPRDGRCFQGSAQGEACKVAQDQRGMHHNLRSSGKVWRWQKQWIRPYLRQHWPLEKVWLEETNDQGKTQRHWWLSRKARLFSTANVNYN